MSTSSSPAARSPASLLTVGLVFGLAWLALNGAILALSLIHISEPTRPY